MSPSTSQHRQSIPSHSRSRSRSRSLSPIEQASRPPIQTSKSASPSTTTKQPPTLPRSSSGSGSVSAAARIVPRIVTRAPTAGRSGFGSAIVGNIGGSRRLFDGSGSGSGSRGRFGERDGEEAGRGYLGTRSGVRRGNSGGLRVTEDRSEGRDHLGILHSNPLDDSSSQPPEERELPDQAGFENEESASAVEIPHPPSFAPFFTLINDLSRVHEAGGGGAGEEGTTYHPRRVRYLFSDDDVGELVAAAARCAVRDDGDEDGGDAREYGDDGLEKRSGKSSLMGDSSETSTSMLKGAQRDEARKTESKTSGKKRAGTSKLEDRVIVIDIDPSSGHITQAVSLSENWQLVNAEVVRAPMWGGDDDDAGMAGTGTGLVGEGKIRSGVEDGSAGGVERDVGAGAGAGAGRKGLMLRVEGVLGRRGGCGSGIREVKKQAEWKRRQKVLNRGEDEDGGEDGDGDEDDGDEDAISGILEEDLNDEQMGQLLDGFEREMAVLRRVVGYSGWSASAGGDGGVGEEGGGIGGVEKGDEEREREGEGEGEEDGDR